MSRGAPPATAALLALLVACGPATGDGGQPAPGSVPLPDLAGVDADVVRAIEQARAAVEADPASSGTWGALGTRYFAHEFEAAAERCFERAEELEPEKAMWPYRRAWTLFDEHPERALPAFERTLVLYPDYAPAWEATGRTLWRLGRIDDARRHLRRATELDAADAHAWTALGQLDLEEGEFERARPHLERALAANPRQVEAHLALAQVLFAMGEEEAGRTHAERARGLPQKSPRKDWLAGLDVAPAGPQARTRAGLQLLRAGRYAQAAQFRVALESHPGATTARIGLANALGLQGDREGALAVLREGLAAQPGDAALRAALRDLEKP